MQTISNLAVQEFQSLGETISEAIDNEFIAVLLFLKDATNSSEELYEKTKKLLFVVNDVLSIKLDVGISESRQSLEDIKQAYQSAKTATRYSFLYGMHSIITEEQIHRYALSGSIKYDCSQIMDAVKTKQ